MTENPKLPVFQTIIDSFVFLFANWLYALGVGLIAVPALFAVDLLYDLPNRLTGWSLPFRVFIGYLATLAYVPVIAVAAIPIHRRILLNEAPASLRFVRPLWPYILRLMLLYTLVWTANMLAYWLLVASYEYRVTSGSSADPLTEYAWYFSLAVYWGASVGLVMLFPMLPAIAVGQYHGVKQAFDLSRGNRLRLIAISCTVLIPAYLVLQTVNDLLGSAYAGQGATMRNAVHAAYFYCQVLIEASAVSLCYRQLADIDAPTVPEPKASHAISG